MIITAQWINISLGTDSGIKLYLEPVISFVTYFIVLVGITVVVVMIIMHMFFFLPCFYF